MIDQSITDFIQIGYQNQEIHPLDVLLKQNQLLALFGKQALDSEIKASMPLPNRLETMDSLVDYAVQEKAIENNEAEKDILAAKIMNLITPLPSEVNRKFWELYQESPEAATTYFYHLSRENDYIKTRAIEKNIEFTKSTVFGNLEITINLSKPEKDPKQIALAKTATASFGYPTCLLCMENEGYEGHLNHPARSNHRIIRLPLTNENWGLQYSPYAYYEEHCIFLSQEHKPMKLEKATFTKLLSIVEQFPHYFVGSNADLPIVGGSILSHDHYQGGRHTFAMAEAPITFPFTLKDYPSIDAGLVKWPMSVIRLRSSDQTELVEAATLILDQWRFYSDESAAIFAETNGELHNTITPIARYKKDQYELDLVLRNNRTTPQYPDGIFHPHQDVQHIKKENIGLIEVMGLAILPPRLKKELAEVEHYLLAEPHQLDNSHQEWADELKRTKKVTKETVGTIIEDAVGSIFLRVLEDAGVYKQTTEGKAAFKRFINSFAHSKGGEKIGHFN
ncbi:Galactose-1-phosphate uridylyltransferase [Marinilactibacillus psychrotolerans 42ea]|uniref:Galactose-1-phosphate uridylyltransferase n=1 Tax=Marinilactibacillus psychrotolerans 42ea TaxID=1255609 RepID=A0A1R4KFF9_9LACT|nr:UDP-glucose--hexose-1-phosphate uridylyltransferase [Marinilactibacillus psychrotolerans]SJN43061.1 Galactose-1-phosphate uridylyltransferase [Marinilactibacillus psychrotolerans 42ea]